MMKRIWVLFVVVVCMQSCATLWNSRSQVLYFKAAQPCTVVHKTDTFMKNSDSGYLSVLRSPDTIRLQLLQDTAWKEVFITQRNSFAFWSNIYFNYGIGMLADRNNPKRYAYPKGIYIGSFGSDTVIRGISIKRPKEKKEAVHLLKISPQRLFNFLQPGLEMSYEVRTGKRFATQITAAYMYPVGYRFALEEKLYFNKRALFGFYISLGADYHQNRFQRVLDFKDMSKIPDSLYYNDFQLPDSLIYQDSVSIHRQIFNANIKFGYQFYRNHWCFDAYVGVGYRYRNVVYHNRINPKDKEPRLATGGTAWGPLDDGAFSVPNFTIGFRVGYIFPVRKRAIIENSFE